jgi:4-hydroxybenzoyl-CoA thioesterase
MKTFTYDRRLQWSECDPAGIIFFPHYAKWMVEGLHMLFFDIGIDPNGRIDSQHTAGLPSVGISLRFHRPARLHEMVTHEITVTKIGRSSLSVKHRFFANGECLAEADDTRVWVSHSLTDASLKSVPFSEDMRRLLQGTPGKTEAEGAEAQEMIGTASAIAARSALAVEKPAALFDPPKP